MKLFFQLCFLFLCCGYVSAQQTDVVDFKTGYAELDMRFKGLDSIKGVMQYTFDVLKSTDTIYLDAKGMEFKNVFLNEQAVTFENDGKRLLILGPFMPSQDNTLNFQYVAVPKRALYTVDREGSCQLWTQGQGKYTSNWLPSIDDVNDKIVFGLAIAADKGYQVLGNGVLDKYYEQDQDNLWFYQMEKPMSSYLVALVIGKYGKMTDVSESGIPLEYYYYPSDSLKAEPTYRYSKQMFDYLEEEIGVSFPWQNYKQVPVRDFLYAGMENTSLTIFSDSYVVDSIAFADKNYLTVNAHELAHQWFGDLVTAKSGAHHWLQEGFATYYALLAERHILGDDHYYWQLFQNAQELLAQEGRGESTSLLDPKSSSITFYKKGAWALHVLRERVGDSAFRSAVRTYLEKHEYGNVETRGFITEVEVASGQDLTGFVNDWLVEAPLQEDEMVRSLKKSPFMQEYFMVDCEVYSSKCQAYLTSYISDEAKVKVISQMPEKIGVDAFQNSWRVRQAIAQYVEIIPVSMKQEYESLLNDRSYVTIEAALYNLWLNFPEDRVKYLQKTKDVFGFNDGNVRLLWLALHLNTLEHQPDKKQEVLNELVEYCLSNKPFELRINAFNYLKLLDAFDRMSIESLLEATSHHNWRFSRFAKTMLEGLAANPKYKPLIEELKNRIN